MNTYLRNITITCLLLAAVSVAFGREGVKLFSIGNNIPWNSASSWSRVSGGSSCGFIPQSNDTIIVESNVILNTNFQLAGNGQLIVSAGSQLKGHSFSIKGLGSSSMQISGSVQVGQLEFNESSSLEILSGSNLIVSGDLVANSQIAMSVYGKLIVQGTYRADAGVNTAQVIGEGSIRSQYYSGVGMIVNMAAGSLPVNSYLSVNNWTGAVDYKWNEAGNWSLNIVPTSLDNISILAVANSPIIEEQAFAHSVLLSPDSKLTLTNGGMLSIDRNLEIEESADLHVINTSTQRCSLIVLGEVIGKIKSEIAVQKDQKVFVASPVAEAQSGVFINMYLRAFDEAQSNWGEYIVPTNVSLGSMKGYELYSPYNDTRVFEGTPNTGEVSQSITSLNEGWNLIGNPYTCYIDWKAEDASGMAWQRSSISKAIYYPDPAGSGNYSVYLPGSEDISINNGSRFIAPMQGFFVKARQSGVVKVNRNAIATQTENPVASLQNTALKFKLEGAGFTDESVIRFDAASTFSFDDDFDAVKMEGTGNAPSIYTEEQDGVKMAVNTMPSLSSSLDIPIGISFNNESQLKLSVEGANQFGFRYPLFLEDKLTGNVIDLRSDSVYTFQNSVSADPSRFVLHFDIIAGTDEINLNKPSIKVVEGMISITGNTEQECQVEVIGIDGRQVVLTNGYINSGLMIPFEGNHGIYVVKVSAKNTCYAHKIYVD